MALAAQDGPVAPERRGVLRLPRLRFQGKVIAVLMAAVCLVQLATLAVVTVVTERSVRDQLGEQLQVGGRVWQHFHEGNDRQLLESVSVLADDFGFKAAVASNDVATMRSALANQGDRLGADFGVLLDGDGEVAATLVPGQPAAQAAALAPLFARARREGAAAGTVVLGGQSLPGAAPGAPGRLYRVALVPVLAPVPIAWVAMGIGVDAAYAERFHVMTGLDASLVGLDGEHMAVFASSLPPAAREALAEVPSSAVGMDQVQRVELGGEPYYAIAEPLRDAAGDTGRLAVLLQGSLSRALAPYAPIRQQILLLTGLVTLLALGAAIWLGRSVTRPLSRLASAAHRVGQGDYSTPLSVRGSDELAQLGDAFARMQDDIAEREAQILHQASHDPLTGLPNRSRAVPLIEAALARTRDGEACCAVLLLDLSRFKEINDTLGHAFGDQVLVEVAKRLRATVRAHDAVLRLGADEFLVVLDNVERGHVRARALALLQALREPLDLPDTRIHLDAGVGLALYPAHGRDPGTLLRRADIALYDAKDERQGVAVYRSGREETHLRRLTLMSDLHKAEQRGELRVEYQPKVVLGADAAADRVAHAEALLRWEHPRLGAVPPDEFVPLAEHAGSVQALTRFVLEAALGENARWRREGLDLGIAVNLSAMDLADPALVEWVDEALRRHRVPPARLILEVTESALMRDVDAAVRVLRRLHGVGAGLAIDDFGTGYSSLAQLKRLPVDELKIDKSFVVRLVPGSDDDVIVRSTIELGHNMGLRVVAEGVEDDAALALLRGHGCDMAQGYRFSRPLPGAALQAWVAAQRAGGPPAGAG